MQCTWLSRWQLQDLMFLQLCCRGFKFSGLWHFVRLFWTAWPLKVRASQSFEMLGATQPTTQCHIPEDMKPWVIFTELLKGFQFFCLLQWNKSCFLNACTAYLRHVGAHSRLIVRHPSSWYSLNFFGLTQGWRTFLRAHAPIVVNFWRNSFAFRKSEFPSAIFLIITVTC